MEFSLTEVKFCLQKVVLGYLEYRIEMEWLVKAPYHSQEEPRQGNLSQLPSKSSWPCSSESKLIKNLLNQINFDLELSGGTSPWAKGTSGRKQEMFWRESKNNGLYSIARWVLIYCSCYTIRCKKGQSTLHSTEECHSQRIKQTHVQRNIKGQRLLLQLYFIIVLN